VRHEPRQIESTHYLLKKRCNAFCTLAFCTENYKRGLSKTNLPASCL
jgi:hypothetical protein